MPKITTIAAIIAGLVIPAFVTAATITQVQSGGTGQTTFTTGSLLLGNGTNPLNSLTGNAFGDILLWNGSAWTHAATSSLGIISGVSSIFGRTGAVTAQSGDYTTDQVTQGSNLYFTNSNARAAFSALYPILYNSGSGIFSTAFGTTTSNTFAGTQTFNNITVNGTCTGCATGSGITGLGNYGTTTGTAISFSTTTASFNGLTLGQSIVPSANAILFTPTITGTLNNNGLTNSSLTVTAGTGLSGGGSVSLGSSITLSNAIGYPFPSNATSTTITFNNGLLATASSTFTGSLHLPSLSSGGLAINSGLVYSGATTTAGTGISYSGNAFNVNTSQNIATLSNLTTNGFVKTSGGTGTLSIDTNTYLTSAVTSLAATYPLLTTSSTGAITISTALSTTTNNTWSGLQTFTNTATTTFAHTVQATCFSTDAVTCLGLTPPGGVTHTVQYNDSGAFTGNTNFSFDPSTNNLSVNGIVTVGANFLSSSQLGAPLVQGINSSGLTLKADSTGNHLVSIISDNPTGKAIIIDGGNISLTSKTFTAPNESGTWALSGGGTTGNCASWTDANTLGDFGLPCPIALALQTNGTPNGSQSLLNLVAGSNVTLTDDGSGNVTIDASGGSGGPSFGQSFEIDTNGNLAPTTTLSLAVPGGDIYLDSTHNLILDGFGDTAGLQYDSNNNIDLFASAGGSEGRLFKILDTDNITSPPNFATDFFTGSTTIKGPLTVSTIHSLAGEDIDVLNDTNSAGFFASDPGNFAGYFANNASGQPFSQISNNQILSGFGNGGAKFYLGNLDGSNTTGFNVSSDGIHYLNIDTSQLTDNATGTIPTGISGTTDTVCFQTLGNCATGGSSFAYPFTPTTNFNTLTSATSSVIYGINGIFASSTSQFYNSTTTHATFGTAWIPSLGISSGTFLAVDPTGKIIATTTPTGAISSVSNSDSSLTISPTTGAVVASLNTAHANTWTANQTFNTGFLRINGGDSGTLGLEYNQPGPGSRTVTFPFNTGTVAETNFAQSWSALQSFSNASSSLLSVFKTAYFGGTATSTFDSTGSLTLPSAATLNGAGLTTCSGTSFLQWSSGLFACGTPTGSSFPFTPTNNFGANTNATSTTLLLTAGLQASSTIRFGNTGIPGFIFDSTTGKTGIGTTTPYTSFAINDVAGIDPFIISSSSVAQTGSGADPFFLVDQFGTTTLKTLRFGDTGANGLRYTIQETPNNDLSFYYPSARRAFLFNTGSGTTASGMLAIGTSTYNSTATFDIASNTPNMLFSDNDGAVGQKQWSLNFNSGIFNIGSTTDSGSLSSQYLTIDGTQGGFIGIGSTTPNVALSVNGQIFNNSTTTTQGLLVIAPTSATSTAYIYSKTAGFGGSIIVEDEGGGACTSITTKTGVVKAQVITCPTEK